MTSPDEGEIRARFRRATLPLAPEALQARVAGVVTTKPSRRPVTLVRFGAGLVAPAAVVVVLALAVLGGGPRRPPDTLGPGAGTSPARLIVEPTVWEQCGPLGCAFHVAIEGSGILWRGELGYADLGEVAPTTPAPPSELPPGTYSIRAEIHVLSDALEEGETEGRDLGTTAACGFELNVPPETDLVALTAGFWLDRCAIGAVVTPDPRSLATLGVLPSFDGVCGGAEVDCEYRLQLSGPGGTWATTLRSPNPPDQVVAGPDLVSMLPPGNYRLDASAHRMSPEFEPGAGHRREESIAAACQSSFIVAADTAHVEASVAFAGETCSIRTAATVLATEPPDAVTPVPSPEFPVICEEVAPPAITCAEMLRIIQTDAKEELSFHGPIVAIEITRRCDGPCPPEPRPVEARVTVTTPPGYYLTYGFTKVGDELSWTALTPAAETEPPSRNPSSVWVEYGLPPPSTYVQTYSRVRLIDDGEILLVEFAGHDCNVAQVPWADQRDDALVFAIGLVARPVPSDTPCVLVLRNYTYRLILPERFTGTVIRDLDGNVYDIGG